MPATHEVALRFAADHPAFDGHFPGQPLLPGVVLLAAVVEEALAVPAMAERLGAAPRIAVAKFSSPVRPGDALTLQLRLGDGRLCFEVRCGERTAASGQFDAAR